MSSLEKLYPQYGSRGMDGNYSMGPVEVSTYAVVESRNGINQLAILEGYRDGSISLKKIKELGLNDLYNDIISGVIGQNKSVPIETEIITEKRSSFFQEFVVAAKADFTKMIRKIGIGKK